LPKVGLQVSVTALPIVRFLLSRCRMNVLERRQIVKGRVIDAVVAKAAVSQSRRERSDATRKLRKALGAHRYASVKADTVSYPRHTNG
jgi:hypothetical protein